MVVGVRADQGLGHDAGPRAQPGLSRPALGHPQNRCGAVGDLGAVARRVHPVGQDRLEAGQTLPGGVPGPLVLGHEGRLAGGALRTHDRCLQRSDLPLEAPLGHRHRRLALGFEPQPVDVIAGDAVLLCDALGGTELVGHVPRELVGLGPAGTVERVGSETHPAHGLDPTGDADLDGIGTDQIGHEIVGLLSRAALAVDRGGRGLVGEALAQPGGPGHVGRLLTGLRDAAADDLLDRARVHAGPLHQLDLGMAEELGGVEAGHPSVALADRRAHCFDDDGLGHGAFPFVRCRPSFQTAPVRASSWWDAGRPGCSPRQYRTGSSDDRRSGRSGRPRAYSADAGDGTYHGGMVEPGTLARHP